MPIPLILVAAGEVATLVGQVWAGAEILDSIGDWFGTGEAAELITDRINQRLQDAGIDVVLPPVNPITDEGQEEIKAVFEKFLIKKLNEKTGAEFTTLAGLNKDVFMVEVGGVLAKRVNRETGANLGALWPIDDLKKNLQTEAMRQFDNRGRYAGGSLFKAQTLALVREKVAQRNPEFLQQVAPIKADGPWGPPLDDKHAQRREKGRARQAKYKQTHSQVWDRKPNLD